MINKYDLCIVIPCFNEEESLISQEYIDFLKINNNVILCFVDDRSDDNTILKMQELKDIYKNRISIIRNDINLGKANSVRVGIQNAINNIKFDHIAYLDADLATSLEETQSLTNYFENDINFAFGSRINKIGSTISRSQARHYIGRIIASFISSALKLRAYDTQCGCKVFTRELAVEVFKDNFISRWLFDVEIFFRIMQFYGRDNSLSKMIEVPLKKWIDPDRGSKVKPTYFFKMWWDLFKIKKQYFNI